MAATMPYDPSGVQYYFTCTAGGGTPLKEPDLYYSEYVEACASAHHFCKIEIDGGELNAEVVDTNGVVIDSFGISH